MLSRWFREKIAKFETETSQYVSGTTASEALDEHHTVVRFANG